MVFGVVVGGVVLGLEVGGDTDVRGADVSARRPYRGGADGPIVPTVRDGSAEWSLMELPITPSAVADRLLAGIDQQHPRGTG